MKKSFLDRISSFSLVLIMIILMLIGTSLIPLLRLSYMPTPEKNDAITVWASWNGASPKVMETEVTSRIEGVVSMLRGIKNIRSNTNNGSASVSITLKEEVNILSTSFELSSLLRSIKDKLPPEVRIYVNERQENNLNNEKSLLGYRIISDMNQEQIGQYAQNMIVSRLKKIDGITNVYVSNAPRYYFEIVFDHSLLQSYGLSPAKISEAVRDFSGQNNILGSITKSGGNRDQQQFTLILSSRADMTNINKAPIPLENGKIVYLQDVARVTYKEASVDNYYRINGLTTVYLNIMVDKHANIIELSAKARAQIEELSRMFPKNYNLELENDSAEQIRKELSKLVYRMGLSLLILLLFVWVMSRNIRYVGVVTVALLANLLIAIIVYYITKTELNLYSMAGIAVSFGILIDTSIIMTYHYVYYRNRSVFVAILAALLTTISALVIILFMPDYVQNQLADFALIIIINLAVSLAVTLLFVPALIEKCNLKALSIKKSVRWHRKTVRFNRFYRRFIAWGQHKKWIFIILLMLTFGIPIYLLPNKIGEQKQWDKPEVENKWYHDLYNKTLGSSFYLSTLKPPLEKWLGGTMRLFNEKKKGNTFSPREEKKVLRITAKMDDGGNASQLNAIVAGMEQFLKQFAEIRRFETTVRDKNAYIQVLFHEQYENGSFPYKLEGEVISKALEFGGAVWSVSGISQNGFSNDISVNRSSNIVLKGYNFDELMRYAEVLSDDIKQNKRVSEVEISSLSPDEYYFYSHKKRADELYIKYDKQQVALYDINVRELYTSLADKLYNNSSAVVLDSEGKKYETRILSSDYEKFSYWTLSNSYINVANNPVRYSVLGTIDKRKTDVNISKENMTYRIMIAFNYIGSYDLANRFVTNTIDKYNSIMPIGFVAANESRWWREDSGTQYWLIFLIVAIIFFICSILFESLLKPLAIILLIPVSFIGIFLIFWLTNIDFGTGGFASMVLMCGIVVNSGIYIINEYNNTVHPDPVKRYVKAYSKKIIPIFMTTFSTILGIMPFMIDGPSEPFWFAFAVGTCGGLLFSFISMLVYLPMFLKLKSPRASQ